MGIECSGKGREREWERGKQRERGRDRKEVIEKDRGKVGEKREKVSKTGKK